MKRYHLDLATFVDAPIERVWELAAHPERLVELTPKIYGLFLKEDAEIKEGGSIHMGLGLKALPKHLDWIAYVESVTDTGPYRHFIDTQTSGPFAYWRHEHIFQSGLEGGTWIRDKVEYELPFGFLSFAHGWMNLWTKNSLAFLFRERQRALKKLLSQPDPALLKGA